MMMQFITTRLYKGGGYDIQFWLKMCHGVAELGRFVGQVVV